MMNEPTEAPNQEKIVNKREYYKNYYKNNKEAITQNKKKYETKLKEERIQSLEVLKTTRRTRRDNRH